MGFVVQPYSHFSISTGSLFKTLLKVFGVVGGMPRPPDPPWKVKTRPCPFYTRGTCLFADSCNFIHTVKAPIAPEIRVTDTKSRDLQYEFEYEAPDIPTPPNVVSPVLSEHEGPVISVVHDSPQNWDAARRYSWESIHSISSADSNLSYPTDPSPTASRASSPRDDIEAILERLSRDMSPDYTVVLKRASEVSAASSKSATATRHSYSRSVPELPAPVERRPTIHQQLEEFSRPRQATIDSPAVQPPLTAESNYSNVSSPNAQIIDVHSPAPLGEAFHLASPKRRRTQITKDHITLFEDPGYLASSPSPPPSDVYVDPEHYASQSRLMDAIPEDAIAFALAQGGPSSRGRGSQQLSLNEVLLNLQDPGLRPRRINRLMMGLSPDTPINTVLQTQQASQSRPSPFQGDGNWKSEAFQKHLANLISTRSAQISRSPPESRSSSFQPMALNTQPGSAPATRASFAAAALSPMGATAHRNPIKMTDVTSPGAGSSTAFKRPARPARKRTGQITPVEPSSATRRRFSPPPVIPGSPELPPPVPRLPSVPSTPSTVPSFPSTPARIPAVPSTPSPPEPMSPPAAVRTPSPKMRMGSLTRTPLTDSPGDFRGVPRTVFSPLEMEDAVAALEAIGEYHQDDVTPQKPSASSSIDRDGVTPKAKEAATTSSSTGSEAILAPLTPLDVVSPKAGFKPLRLSVLFDQVQAQANSTPARDTRSKFDTATAKRKSRRPLSALLLQDEDLETLPLRSSYHTAPLQSSSPRKPANLESNHLHTPLSSELLDTQPSPGYPFPSTPLRIPRSSSSKAPTPFASPSKQPFNSSSPRPGHNQLDKNLFSPPLQSPTLQPQSRTHSSHNIQNLTAQHTRNLSSQHATRPRHVRSHSSQSSISSVSTTSTTPKPLLFFAMARDDVREVERLLASGEAGANDRVGPDELHALQFVMENEGLKNRTEIIKTLLAYGADPTVLQSGFTSSKPNSPAESEEEEGDRRDSILTIRPSKSPDSPGPLRNELARQFTMAANPEIDYYLTRVPEIPPKQLEALNKAGFDPLTRMPFVMVGQDLVLSELLRVLARHSQRSPTSPVSIIFAGPSGHGKSLLSRSIGELLRIPAHTVNMTNLQTQDELLQSRSLSSSKDNLTLAAFLAKNEGRRCAVILEEIEKVADKNASNTLLMPWELGKLNTTSRVYDTSHVIWISTSNAGEDIVLDFERNRGDWPCERNEYLDLATGVRRKLIDSLGASLVSRITTVLPFLAFTETEKIALAHHYLPKNTLSKPELESLLQKVVQDYIPSEGVRSMQRAVQRHYDEDFW